MKAKLCLLVMFMFYSHIAASAEKKLSIEELRAIQAQMKSSDSLSVDFVQKKFSGLRGKSTERHGHADFLKPSRFRWLLETPTKDYKIYDGKHFYDYDPATQTAKRYAATGAQAAELKRIIDFVLNFDALLKQYDLVEAIKKDDLVEVKLKAKDSPDLDSVELTLALKEEFISFLKLNFKNKNSLSHEFSNPKHSGITAEAIALPRGVKITDGL